MFCLEASSVSSCEHSKERFRVLAQTITNESIQGDIMSYSAAGAEPVGCLKAEITVYNLIRANTSGHEITAKEGNYGRNPG